MNALAADLLAKIRNHEGLPELLKLVSRPRIQPAKVNEAPEVAHNRFVYQSGQVDQDQKWLFLLTGKQPSQQENE